MLADAMDNLSGLVIEVGRQTHAATMERVRSAYLAAGFREAATGSVRVRVGAPRAGLALVTDEGHVTFDEDVARELATATSGALFAVRDLGYRKGRRVQRAAFLPLDGKKKWKRKPKRAQHVDDVYRAIAGLGLLPHPWEVDTREGTTLRFVAPPKRTLFPPRDGDEQREAARAQNRAGMLLNLRPASKEQWPPESPCETLSWWLPAPLPPEAEAIVACVPDEHLRAQAWVHLADQLRMGSLAFDERTARVLRQLRTSPPSYTEVTRHPSNVPGELGVAWLLARRVKAPVPELDDAAALAAASVALEHDALQLLDGVDLPALAKKGLGDRDVYRASLAARLLAVVTPASLDLVKARAAQDAPFAQRLGVHGASGLARHHPEAALRLLDAVQPFITDEAGAWCHATALWLTWSRLGARPKADVGRTRRLDLALAQAVMHAPSMSNAVVLAEAVKDKARATAAAQRLRKLDRKHALLKRYPVTAAT